MLSAAPAARPGATPGASASAGRVLCVPGESVESLPGRTGPEMHEAERHRATAEGARAGAPPAPMAAVRDARRDRRGLPPGRRSP
ncbi:MAG: hypothetical protein ACRD03_02780 [Acidimicrobiales bacterium]